MASARHVLKSFAKVCFPNYIAFAKSAALPVKNHRAVILRHNKAALS